MGIYKDLICHRQKHLESGSRKATVVFGFGSGSWLGGLGVIFVFQWILVPFVTFKNTMNTLLLLKIFTHFIYTKCKQIFSTENRLINAHMLMFCRFLLRKCHYGKDANWLWKLSCKPMSLRDALHLTEPERLLLNSQTALFAPKMTVQDTGRIKELNMDTFSLDLQLQ